MKILKLQFLTWFFLIALLGCQQDMSAPPDYDITLYAATYAKGIYQSINGGKSWYPLDLHQSDLYMYFKRIFMDPRDKDIIYVTKTGGGLFQINLLQSTLEKRALFSEKNINSIAFLKSPTEQKHDLLLLGFNGIGIFRTIGDYEVWQPFNQGLSYRDVNVVFTHEQDMYAGTVHDLFQYDNNAKKWTSISKGIKNRNIYSIDTDLEGSTLYAGSGAYPDERGFFEKIPCLYKSPDHGKTWIASDKGVPDGTLVYSIAVNKKQPERIYLGTSQVKEGVSRYI